MSALMGYRFAITRKIMPAGIVAAARYVQVAVDNCVFFFLC